MDTLRSKKCFHQCFYRYLQKHMLIHLIKRRLRRGSWLKFIQRSKPDVHSIICVISVFFLYIFHNLLIWSPQFHINGVRRIFTVKLRSWVALTLLNPKRVNIPLLFVCEASSHINWWHSFNSQPTSVQQKEQLEKQVCGKHKGNNKLFKLPYFVPSLR